MRVCRRAKACFLHYSHGIFDVFYLCFICIIYTCRGSVVSFQSTLANKVVVIANDEGDLEKKNENEKKERVFSIEKV